MTLTEIKRVVSNKDAYDILCALRGPDLQAYPVADNVKSMTTAVIRHFLGMKELTISANVTSAEEAKVCWASWTSETKQAVTEFLRNEGHFRSHLRTAFIALKTIRSYRAWAYYEWLISEGIL